MQLAALADWETQARQYIGGLHSSVEWPNAVPQTDEKRRERFEMKRQIVKLLIQKVLINKAKSLGVICYLGVLTLLEQADVTEQVQMVEICSRTQSTRPPLPRGAYG